MSSGINWEFDKAMDVSKDSDGSATVTPGVAWASGRNQKLRLAVLPLGFREFVDETKLPKQEDTLLEYSLKFDITLSHFKDKQEWALSLVQNRWESKEREYNRLKDSLYKGKSFAEFLASGNAPPNGRNHTALVEEIERIV